MQRSQRADSRARRSTSSESPRGRFRCSCTPASASAPRGAQAVALRPWRPGWGWAPRNLASKAPPPTTLPLSFLLPSAPHAPPYLPPPPSPLPCHASTLLPRHIYGGGGAPSSNARRNSWASCWPGPSSAGVSARVARTSSVGINGACAGVCRESSLSSTCAPRAHGRRATKMAPTTNRWPRHGSGKGVKGHPTSACATASASRADSPTRCVASAAGPHPRAARRRPAATRYARRRPAATRYARRPPRCHAIRTPPPRCHAPRTPPPRCHTPPLALA